MRSTLASRPDEGGGTTGGDGIDGIGAGTHSGTLADCFARVASDTGADLTSTFCSITFIGCGATCFLAHVTSKATQMAMTISIDRVCLGELV